MQARRLNCCSILDAHICGSGRMSVAMASHLCQTQQADLRCRWLPCSVGACMTVCASLTRLRRRASEANAIIDGPSHRTAAESMPLSAWQEVGN